MVYKGAILIKGFNIKLIKRLSLNLTVTQTGAAQEKL